MTAQGRIQPLGGGRARSMPACGRGKWALVALVPLMLLATACGVIHGKYYYFSFEERSDLRTLEYGKAKPSGRLVTGHDVMPVSYELVDDAYTVYLDVDVTREYPRILLRASSHEGAFYRIQGVFPLDINPKERCGRFYDPHWRDTEINPYWKEKEKNPRKARRKYPHWEGLKKAPTSEKVRVYVWLVVKEHCLADNGDTEEVLSFRVFDEDDVLVGEETLLFDVIRNGHYILSGIEGLSGE